MKSLTIDILNPKALKLLIDLQDVGLISIADKTPEFLSLIDEMQQLGEESAITDEEIMKEVKASRKARHAG